MDVKPKTILVVDDEIDLRNAVQELLGISGFRVLTAAGGHEALDLVSREKVDLVLSDVRMPEGNGLFLLDKLKEACPDTPLVFMTGYADLTIEDALDRGAEGLFAKPIDIGSMVDYARTLFKEIESNWDGYVKPSIPELSYRIEGARNWREQFKIGRCGFVIQLESASPRNEKQFTFDIRVTSEQLIVEGAGSQVWKRKAGLNDYRGIRWTNLSRESLASIKSYLQRNPTVSFVPRYSLTE